jgi:hypothetical protein
MQELVVVLLWVKKVQRKLGNDAQVLIEHVGRQDPCISLVFLITGTGHVSDGVQKLDQ